MNNMINLTAYLPQQAKFAQTEQRRKRWAQVSAFFESLATLIIAGGFLLFVVAYLSTL